MPMLTIDTTIEQLVTSLPALERVAAVKFDKTDGAKVRYHVVKLIKLVRAEVDPHFHEPRQQLMKDLGTERSPTPEEIAQNPVAAGKTIFHFEGDALRQFSDRLKALGDVPVTIPWGPVTSRMFELYPEITAADMDGLGPLFELVDPSAPKSDEKQVV